MQKGYRPSWIRGTVRSSLLWGIFVAIIFCGIGIAIGWDLEYHFTWDKTPTTVGRRLAGYDLVSPLLTCSLLNNENFSSSRTLTARVEDQVQREIMANNITTAAVYVQDLNGGTWAYVNRQERFYPASLGKVPIMMAYFKSAESNPSLLDKTLMYNGGLDLNEQQEIPADPPLKSGTYTIRTLISSMIDYSDNNAARLLTDAIDPSALDETYSDLDVPILNNPNANNLDFMGVADYSRFFRVLYNATYLSPGMSEVALTTLTKTSFVDGIVAGVPASTTVAHKFGLTTLTSNSGAVTGRELHDCGIVYAPGHPYFVCIMTKSSSSISRIETAIKDISSVIYGEVKNGYR